MALPVGRPTPTSCIDSWPTRRVTPKSTDPNLVNAWGLAAGPTTPWWVNAADNDVSTLYDGKGAVLPLVVDVSGGPTGLVFNGSTNFVVSNGTASGPSLFLFATEGGTINGWNPNVPPPSPSTHSFVVADESGQGASYKGLAIASTAAGDMLYAADFHNARVDMFDGTFNPVSTASTFVDPNIPARLRAVRDPGHRRHDLRDVRQAGRRCGDEVAGPGKGFVDAFDTDGDVRRPGRVAHKLNAPWGLAMAPSDFGAFSGDLLVGNFGDGRILAFHRKPNGSYKAAGALWNSHGKVLTIDGLWANRVRQRRRGRTVQTRSTSPPAPTMRRTVSSGR